MEKLNREQRRQAKFGGGRASEQGGWPTSEPNPVFGAEDASDDKSAFEADTPDEAAAGEPAQGKTKETRPAAGGATKQAGRAPRREGAKPGNSTKG
jgi:hypothetical protein